jgi:NADPH:quinone reductase-like Zn-dependent oxidoreductase
VRAARLHARGSLEGLVVEEAPAPRPGAGEVLIEVHAAGVTPTELAWPPTWTTREGTPRALPRIPGHEFSGVVAAAGPGADLAVGDAVYGLSDWYGEGAQAELCVARAAELAPKPQSLDHAEAAVVPISALTAWQALFVRGLLGAGQLALIHGGAGAVGGFAVQLARWRGARVAATAGAADLDFVRALGANVVLDYRASRFEEELAGVDVVLDTVGGDALARSRAVLAPGGRLVAIAASSEESEDARVRDAFFIVEPSRAQLVDLGKLIDAGSVHPQLGAVYPLEEAPEAWRRAARGGLRGKLALRVRG